MLAVPRAHQHTRGRVVFVADTHLDADRPAAIERFEALCARCRERGNPVYILGDLFDLWVGDDDDSTTAQRVAGALARLGHRVPTWLMRGNRDFLIGADFLARTNVRALPEPYTISLFGQRAVLCHGDTLCTGDSAYQRMRQQVRDPRWQAQFLERPLAARREIARSLRADSEHAAADKAPTTMDVSAPAVESLLRAHRAELLIHGHTHHPDTHAHSVDGRRALRFVLPDWLTQRETEVLVADGHGLRALALEAC